MEWYNNVMADILMKYPVTNDNQWKYDVDGITSYITNYTGGGYDSDILEQKYDGIRGIFVRHSVYDDDDSLGYEYNNVDPWFRKFKAYKNGNKTRYNKQYMCEPIFGNLGFHYSVPKAYVLTTSIEGSMIYCLEVIEHIK